jgi:hypothetical protein
MGSRSTVRPKKEFRLITTSARGRIVSHRHKLLRQMRPDESGPSDNQNLHAYSLLYTEIYSQLEVGLLH